MSEDKEAAILTVNIDNPGLNETPSESRVNPILLRKRVKQAYRSLVDTKS